MPCQSHSVLTRGCFTLSYDHSESLLNAYLFAIFEFWDKSMNK